MFGQVQIAHGEYLIHKNRVNDLKQSITEHELQLAEEKRQLHTAEQDLEAFSSTTKDLLARFAASPGLTHPHDADSVNAAASALDLRHLESPPATSTAGEYDRMSQDENDEGDRDYTEPGCKTNFPSKSAAKQPHTIHPSYRNIINNKGQWTEISCYICNANAISSGSFFNGVNGLHIHVMQEHFKGETSRTFQDTLAKCNKRAVSDRDVLRMEAGKSPLDKKIVVISNVPQGQVAYIETNEAGEHEVKTRKISPTDVLSASSPQGPHLKRCKRRRPSLDNSDDSEPESGIIKGKTSKY